MDGGRDRVRFGVWERRQQTAGRGWSARFPVFEVIDYCR